MRERLFVIAALVCFSSAAIAQDGSAWPGAARSFTALSVGASASGRVLRNANDCAPDRATAVWDANEALLGYACSTRSANR
jgi:hypothetical protein